MIDMTNAVKNGDQNLSGVKFETDDEIKEASAAALYQLPDVLPTSSASLD